MINILYEDDDLLVVDKPPGMPVQKDFTRDLDVLSWAEGYVQQKMTIGLVHRLDRSVGGVLVLTKNHAATKSLSAQIQERTVQKRYLALCEGISEAPKGIWVDYLAKDNRQKAIVVDSKDSRGKMAKLSYRVLEQMTLNNCPVSLLDITLMTGRFHQIRAQLATHGLPIIGDTKYNPNFQQKKGWHQLQLASYYFGCKHPKNKQAIHFVKMPDYFEVTLKTTDDLWEAMGDDANN